MCNAPALVRPRSVTGEGTGIASHAGVVWLAEAADLADLRASWAQRWRQCRRGVVIQGGRSRVSSSRWLMARRVCRNLPRCGPSQRGIASARASARERAWAGGAGPAGEDLIIELDATLVTGKAGKQDAVPTCKRGHGHRPLLAMTAGTDEVLAAILRPGNAGSNSAP